MEQLIWAVLASPMAWITAFVFLRGRGSAHGRALACFEAMGWTLVLAALLLCLVWDHADSSYQLPVAIFFILSEIVAGGGAMFFLLLADLEERRFTSEGTGLTPLKGE